MIGLSVQAEPKAFNCPTCFERFCDADRPAPYDKWQLPDGTPSRVCLLPMVTDHTRELLRYADHYRAGFLPWSGGMLAQPNKFIQAIEVITQHAQPKS